jgi:bromodomain-containing factor 1
LDIDQLSNEALLKLWELCKKVLPGFGKDSSVASPEATRGGGSKGGPKTAAKPKKNKPMSAQEQEARIAQLQGLRDMYKGGNADGGESAHSPPQHSADPDSSEDSSEEE